MTTLDALEKEHTDQTPAALVHNPIQLIERWEEWMVKSRNLSPNTVRLYRATVVKFAGEIPDFLYATEETIQAWLQSKGGKPGTFNNRASGLISFYRWARKNKLILVNPCDELDLPKRTKGVPKPVENLDDALRALDAADIRANERGTQPRRVGETRDIAVFLAETGLRIHELALVNLPVPAPDHMTIVGKGRKEAIVELTDKAREAIDRLGGHVRIGARAIQRRFERADFHPHQLRHWRATSLVQAGVEIGTVSKIMRHSSPSITMIYSQYNRTMMQDALAKVK